MTAREAVFLKRLKVIEQRTKLLSAGLKDARTEISLLKEQLRAAEDKLAALGQPPRFVAPRSTGKQAPTGDITEDWSNLVIKPANVHDGLPPLPRLPVKPKQVRPWRWRTTWLEDELF